MSIPLPLETPRLTLRAFDPADIDAMAAVYGDPEVMRHVCLGVLDRDAVAALLDGYAHAQDERGFSSWGVVERQSGRLVGDAGFGLDEPTGEPELGYTLAAAAWGHGYATEAARSCVEAAFAHLGVPRVLAKVEVGNARSHRVAEKLGMRALERIHVHGRPHVLYALERA